MLNNESKTLSKDWVISIRKIPNFHKMKCLCLFFVVIVPRISKKCQFALIKFFKNPDLVTLHFVKRPNHAIFAKGFRFVGTTYKPVLQTYLM